MEDLQRTDEFIDADCVSNVAWKTRRSVWVVHVESRRRKKQAEVKDPEVNLSSGSSSYFLFGYLLCVRRIICVCEMEIERETSTHKGMLCTPLTVNFSRKKPSSVCERRPCRY